MIRRLAPTSFALAWLFGFVLIVGGPAAALAPVAPGNGFYVDISLTAGAISLLQKRQETLRVDVSYSRYGKPLGGEQVAATAVPARVLIPAASLSGQMNQGIKVAVELHRVRGGSVVEEDGVSCIQGEGDLSSLQLAPMALYCSGGESADPGKEPHLPPGVQGRWIVSVPDRNGTDGKIYVSPRSSWMFQPSDEPAGGFHVQSAPPPRMASYPGTPPVQPDAASGQGAPRRTGGTSGSAASSEAAAAARAAAQAQARARAEEETAAAAAAARAAQADARARAEEAAAAAAAASLRNFPWPPPLPSEKMNLPHAALAAGSAGHPTLATAGHHLVDVLTDAGYLEYSYFRAPGGFALVARLEQFQEDGSPGPADRRFLDPQSSAPFSLSSYIAHLFVAPDGYYRLIVFVVSDRSFAPSRDAPSAAAAQSWLVEGANALPAAFDRIPVSDNHQLTALIYEFHKHGSDAIATLDPGRLDARTHLLKAGLYNRLAGGTH